MKSHTLIKSRFSCIFIRSLMYRMISYAIFICRINFYCRCFWLTILCTFFTDVTITESVWFC